jgi:hypothetical protein
MELIHLMRSSHPPFQVGVPGIGTVNHLASVLFAHRLMPTVPEFFGDG